MSYGFVECQGFAGGFALGAVQAGLRMLTKVEDGRFGLPSCEANRHLLGHSWEAYTSMPSWPTPRADVVLGNPSCGGFSVKSVITGGRGAARPSNIGMWQFARYAARVKPRVAVFESVYGARAMPEGLELMRELHRTLERESGLEYRLTHVRHSAHLLGGAAVRQRYFWVASVVPFGVGHRPSAPATLRDVIGDLEDQPLAWEPRPYAAPPTWWSRPKRAEGAIDGHAVVESAKADRLADLLAGPFPWAQGEYLEQFVERYRAAGLDLPPSVAATHIGYGKMVRWNYDEPARVVVRDTSTIAIHPVLPRFLTHREVARVMGLPDDWRIGPLRGTPYVAETFGKGVTVECGRWIMEWVRRSLDGEPGAIAGEQIGAREFDIDVSAEPADVIQ